MKNLLLCSLLLLAHLTQAKTLKAGCAPATAQRDLDINNVRTTILNGGDMWWNLSNSRYEVPKAQVGRQLSKNALDAGSLWFGGISNGNLRLAAQTYRQNGNDFFPGPLSNATALVDQQTCEAYNQIWKVTLAEITDFKNTPSQWANPDDDFLTWPAMGNTSIGQAQYLAPFIDQNGNGEYDVHEGEYPTFEFNNTANIPDMMLFWIYNDKGNIHSETQGVPLGIELQACAFAYSTNDHLNNSTFYKTTIINRSMETLDSVIVAQWTDGSLGNYSDDYIQFDCNQQMMITYNGDDNDEGIMGYGLNPPSVGIVMLGGPKSPGGDELPVDSFMAYNNDWSAQGNPTTPEHYWNYMNGRWKNGALLTYGGAGVGGSDTTRFMYPGLTDARGRSEWTESTAQNVPGDRRGVVSFAPFSLLPGSVNQIVYGVVWARNSSGGALGSLPLLNEACNQAKELFEQDFVYTGIRKMDSPHNTITLYPNPGASEIHIDGAIEANSEISFYDIKGAVVFTTQLQSSIDISNLKKGTYFYQIKNRNQQVIQSGKWFKN